MMTPLVVPTPDQLAEAMKFINSNRVILTKLLPRLTLEKHTDVQRIVESLLSGERPQTNEEMASYFEKVRRIRKYMLVLKQNAAAAVAGNPATATTSPATVSSTAVTPVPSPEPPLSERWHIFFALIISACVHAQRWMESASITPSILDQVRAMQKTFLMRLVHSIPASDSLHHRRINNNISSIVQSLSAVEQSSGQEDRIEAIDATADLLFDIAHFILLGQLSMSSSDIRKLHVKELEKIVLAKKIDSTAYEQSRRVLTALSTATVATCQERLHETTRELLSELLPPNPSKPNPHSILSESRLETYRRTCYDARATV